MGEGDTLVNAIVGAVAGLLLFFVPFSPVIGGAVAGYLQREDYEQGAIVGALSGVLAAIPGALLVTAVAVFFTLGIGVAGAGASIVGFLLIFLLITLGVALYTVALGAIGGVVGAYLAEEYGDDDSAARTESVADSDFEDARR